MSSNRSIRALLTSLTCLGITMTVQAASLSDESLTPQRFPAAAASIKADLKSGGSLENLDNDKKAAIEQSLERIERYLIDPQAHADRIEEEQSYVNTLLDTQMADASNESGKYCRRERRMGSNIPETVCYERKNKDEDRQKVRDDFERMR